MDLQEYQELTNKIQQIEKNIYKLDATIEQQECALREFGCNSLEQAQVLLGTLESERDVLQVDYDKSLLEWEREWSQRLE